MKPERGEMSLWLKKLCCSLAVLGLLGACTSGRAEWKPAEGPLMTRWAKHVSPKNAHPEYPRPQMVRKDWLNLNGLWDYAIRPKDEPQPEKFDGQILVPFPAESALSGVTRPVGDANNLWYRRAFETPGKWKGRCVLLHFGAVDWETTVWVNGKEVGMYHGRGEVCAFPAEPGFIPSSVHRGGYDPFTFDITDALNKTGPQEIVLSVWDPTNSGGQPRGKQVKQPGGIWYTAVTGIWQTVWLEPVPKAHIEWLRIVPNVDAQAVDISLGVKSLDAEVGIEIAVLDGEKEVTVARIMGSGAGREIMAPRVELAVEDPKLWSPDTPFLYNLKVTLAHDGKVVDKLSSYFGMRKISLDKDEKGITRLFLNNKPLFQFGPLDQGWWPDGLYTAPTDEALRYDIEVLKKLGCNMMRKHVKIEPLRFYYWCDKLGLMVWQDMPSGDNRTDADKKQFEQELTQLVRAHYNHPSIVMWVPFNEGWGQHDTPRYVELIKELDATRLVNNASGWKDTGVGDVHDIHSYPGPAAPPTEENRAAVLGEFGGLGLPVKGHTWQDEKNWGYRSFETREQLTDAYVSLLARLRMLIGQGLSAAVYTQTTDVEIEVNGFMTYDRAMVKADAKKAAAANRKLYLPPPLVKTIVPTSQNRGIEWRYMTTDPGNGWEKTAFDDSSWKRGPGGFGREGTPGSIVRTGWTTSDIWLRRAFDLKSTNFDHPHLSIHHDEDAEVYINGVLAAKLTGYTTSYVQFPLGKEASRALKAGSSCLAVHCHQTQGGQYIDVGIVDVVEQSTR
jgi:hypothetical protein